MGSGRSWGKTEFPHLQDKMFPLRRWPVCVKGRCGQACFWAFAHAVPSSGDTIHLNPPQPRCRHMTDINDPSVLCLRPQPSPRPAGAPTAFVIPVSAASQL